MRACQHFNYIIISLLETWHSEISAKYRGGKAIVKNKLTGEQPLTIHSTVREEHTRGDMITCT